MTVRLARRLRETLKRDKPESEYEKGEEYIEEVDTPNENSKRGEKETLKKIAPQILIKSSNDRYKATLEPMGATLILTNDDTDR